MDLKALKPDEIFTDREKNQKIVEAINQLPPRMQACMKFRILQGLKYREIADVMDLSIETVKSLIFQAKAKLRSRLQPYFDDG